MIFNLKRIYERRMKGNEKSDGVQSIFQDLEEKNILMERRLKSCLTKLAFSDKKKVDHTLTPQTQHLPISVNNIICKIWTGSKMHEMLHFEFFVPILASDSGKSYFASIFELHCLLCRRCEICARIRNVWRSNFREELERSWTYCTAWQQQSRWCPPRFQKCPLFLR